MSAARGSGAPVVSGGAGRGGVAGARVAGSALARVRLREAAPPGSRVGEIQRARLLAGAVEVIGELGYPCATVGRITARARVSRRTFYQVFANCDECFAAVLQEVLATVLAELASAGGLEGLAWRERVRRGLWTILVFLEREPALARVCVVQALRAGPLTLECRDEILARLAAVVDEGRAEGARGEGLTALTAEGLVGAAFAVVYARLSRGDREPLSGLLGELMGLIVLPYLGPAVARRERVRPAPAVSGVALVARVAPRRGVRDPLAEVDMRLTHRTARVLEGVAELAGHGSDPSNRQVAAFAGVSDPGQISKLLRRLEGLGLLLNTGAGHAKGEPNAWVLTEKGRRITQSIRLHTSRRREAA